MAWAEADEGGIQRRLQGGSTAAFPTTPQPACSRPTPLPPPPIPSKPSLHTAQQQCVRYAAVVVVAALCSDHGFVMRPQNSDLQIWIRIGETDQQRDVLDAGE